MGLHTALASHPQIVELRVTSVVQVADLLERLPAWRERDDFVAPLPVPTVKEYERTLPEHAPPPLNPDWDPWDFRSGPAAAIPSQQHPALDAASAFAPAGSAFSS